MKKNILLLLTILINLGTTAQVAINTTGAIATESAILDVSSSSKGILIPRLTTNGRTTIDSPANGLMVYDTETNSFWYYHLTYLSWIEIVTTVSNNLDGLTDGKAYESSSFLGTSAGRSSTASNCTGIGHGALYANTTGSSNNAFGSFSLFNNTIGFFNVAVGSLALRENTSGSSNIAIGTNSLFSNITGSANIAIGYASNYFNETGTNNTIIGFEAGKGTSAHSKSGNIFLGYRAGYNETGDNKLYIENSNSDTPLIGGDFANDSIFLNGVVRITGGSPGADKILTSDEDGNATWETPQWGATQLNDLTDGKSDLSSVFIGDNAGINDEGANRNTGIGVYALGSTTSGNRNIAFGAYSLYNNANGEFNTASGTYSLYNNTNGDRNTAIGYSSLFSNISSDYNCAVGYEVLKDNTGEKNTAFGAHSSGNNTTGTNNVTMGYASNYFNETGTNNTIVGYQAGRGTSLHNKSGNIFLGYQAGYNETGSNKLYIENSNSSTPLIGGDFDADEVYFNTLKLGIGTSNPREILEVASTTGSYGRMIVSDGGGDERNAILFVSPTTSNQTARIEAFNYDIGSGLTLNINTTGNGAVVFGGNVLPESHISKNIGASGQAWNNVYAHNYVTQGSAAFADINVTQQLIEFPPTEKQAGAFDEFTEKGLKELDPTSLPEFLKENNAILIDEMTTYNYKANYEQQLQIEELLNTNKNQQKIINELIIRLNQLENK